MATLEKLDLNTLDYGLGNVRATQNLQFHILHQIKPYWGQDHLRVKGHDIFQNRYLKTNFENTEIRDFVPTF